MKIKKRQSLQVPAPPCMVETQKFPASRIQVGHHTCTNLQSLQHCLDMNRLLFLLTWAISFRVPNARCAFHTYPVEPLRSVSGGAAGLILPWLLEKLPICQILLGVSSTAQGAAAPPLCTESPWNSGLRAARAMDMPGWQGSGAGSAHLAETLVCFPCRWSTLQ